MNTMTTAIPQFDSTEVEKWKIQTISQFQKMKWMDLLQPQGTTIQPQTKTHKRWRSNYRYRRKNHHSFTNQNHC